MREHEMLERDLAGWLDGPRASHRPGEPPTAGRHDPGHVVACSSGTAALHLSLETLTVGLPDAERARSVVIVPDLTMVAVARAVVLAGMRPVFCDVLDGGPHHGTLDPIAMTAVSWGKGERLRAVVAVASCGRPCDPRVFDRAALYSVPVVEDLAEAHGLPPDPRSYAACWSFYRNKIVAGEEGGAVLFQSQVGWSEADYARQLRCQGFTPAHDYTHLPRGHNYRLADLLATPIRASLAAHPANVLARRLLVEGYHDRLAAEHRLYPDAPRSADWVYDVRVRGLTPESQRRLVLYLQDAGVPARFGFKPLRLQPEFTPLLSQAEPAAEWTSDRLGRETVHLPLTPGPDAHHRPAAAAAVFGRVLTAPQ